MIPEIPEIPETPETSETPETPDGPGSPIDSETTTHELDCRGMICPRPIIELAKRITAIEVGEIVAVAATDSAAAFDVPAWCRMRDQEYLGEEPAADGVPRYLVRRLR